MTWLDCSHCGGMAIESPDGMYYDGAGEACATCGYPGAVSVDDAGPEDPEAWWRASDEPGARCRDPECVGCRGLDEEMRAEASADAKALREEER